MARSDAVLCCIADESGGVCCAWRMLRVEEVAAFCCLLMSASLWGERVVCVCVEKAAKIFHSHPLSVIVVDSSQAHTTCLSFLLTHIHRTTTVVLAHTQLYRSRKGRLVPGQSAAVQQ